MQMKVYSLVKVPERKKVIKSTVSEQDFQGAQLTYLTGREIFERCFHKGTNTFLIPEGFTHITEYGLDAYKFDMERLVIPKSMLSIDENTFKNCNKLKVIEVDRDNPVYFVLNGVLCKKNTYEQVWAPSQSVLADPLEELKRENMWLKARVKVLEDYISEQGLNLPLKQKWN